MSKEKICRLLGITRMGMYKKEKRQAKLLAEAELIIHLVKKIKGEQRRIGVRKLQVLLRESLQGLGIKIGRDGLFDLLREFDMLVKAKRYKQYTTQSRHLFYKYPNKIKEKVADRPNQLWVSDITYIEVGPGFNYLFLITDGCSRKIVGHCLSDSYAVKGAIAALQMAFKQNKTQPGLIHHSDRGIQYCCQQYTSILNKKGVVISMTENSDPYENAIAERVNGILKTELLKTSYQNTTIAMKCVAKAVNIYNSKRPHMSINMLTPDKAHQFPIRLKQLWKKKEYTKENMQNQPILL